MSQPLLLMMLCPALFLVAAPAHSTLFMTVSDDGFGNSRLVFSGSATAAVAFGGTNNGFYVRNSFFPSPFLVADLDPIFYSIISGGGTVSSSASGTFSVVDVLAEEVSSGFPVGAAGFGTRTNGVIRYLPGAVLSWSGDLVTSLPFNSFFPGTYTTDTIAGFVTLDSPYVLVVVPEPSTALLFGLGLVGLRMRGRRPMRPEPTNTTDVG